MAKNFRGVYQSRKELNHQIYGKDLELVVERTFASIRKWMGGISSGLKEMAERAKDRNALNGEFHVIPNNQLLIGQDDAIEQS